MRMGYALAVTGLLAAGLARGDHERDRHRDGRGHGHGHGVSCSVSAAGVAFGSYSELRIGSTDSTGSVSVTCSGRVGTTVVYSIELAAAGRGYHPRAMTSAEGGVLRYNMYTTAARTHVWGDAGRGTDVVADGYRLNAPTVTRHYPIYGRIFARQKVRVGVYTDAIVVTLKF